MTEPCSCELDADAHQHPQVECSRGGGVDEQLLGLLESVWKCGIDTQYSCQGEPGEHEIPAMILFPTVPDGVAFLEETMRLMNWDSRASELMILAIVNPMPRGDDPETKFWYPGAEPRTEVMWDLSFTPFITTAWQESEDQRKGSALGRSNDQEEHDVGTTTA
jgi:hypothetical protein